MEVIRRQKMNVRTFKVGDQITVGKYTATCQRLTDKTAIFLLDQYIDKSYTMTELISKDFTQIQEDSNFESIKTTMVKFDSGKYFRLATIGEMFGPNDFYEDDGCEQWELMKDRRNRIAFRKGDLEWGWLMNKTKMSSTAFAHVADYGFAGYGNASNSFGVRPVFQLKRKIDAPCGRNENEHKESIPGYIRYIRNDIDSTYKMVGNLSVLHVNSHDCDITINLKSGIINLSYKNKESKDVK